jgi:SAM-dependent methyltransferase
MTAVDLGCAMGFFTLEAARLVGDSGRVIAVDLQPRMLRSLDRRVRRAGLGDRIESRRCSDSDLGLEDIKGSVDFALAFAVVHEVPDSGEFMRQVAVALRPDGVLLVAEPKGHVSRDDFRESLSAAEQAGLHVVDRPAIRRSHAAVLRRPVR